MHIGRGAASAARRQCRSTDLRPARIMQAMGAAQQAGGTGTANVFFLDSFAVRQWEDPSYSGTRMQHDPADFLDRVHQ